MISRATSKLVPKQPAAPPSKSFSAGVMTTGAIFGGLLAAAYAYLLSRWLYPVYYLGDQIHYTNFWHSVSDAHISEVWRLQLLSTGSAEPVFGAIVWIGSRGFEKIHFFSLMNALFSATLFAILMKYRVPLIVLPAIFLNYYYIVLLIPMERLKVSLIFIMIFFLTRGAKAYFVFSLGLLTHFQNLIFLLSLALHKTAGIAADALVTGRLRARNLLGLFALGAAGVVFLVIFQEALFRKFSHYFDVALFDALETVIMMAIVLIFCRQRASAIAIFFPVALAAILVGQDRVSMVAFLVLSAFFIMQRKSLHPAFLSLLMYLDVKAIFFVNRILEYNTGFGK